MEDPNEIQAPRRYVWPWVALAMVVLGFVLAVIWMSYAVQQEERQRDFSAPLPSHSTP